MIYDGTNLSAAYCYLLSRGRMGIVLANIETGTGGDPNPWA